LTTSWPKLAKQARPPGRTAASCFPCQPRTGRPLGFLVLKAIRSLPGPGGSRLAAAHETRLSGPGHRSRGRIEEQRRGPARKRAIGPLATQGPLPGRRLAAPGEDPVFALRFQSETGRTQTRRNALSSRPRRIPSASAGQPGCHGGSTATAAPARGLRPRVPRVLRVGSERQRPRCRETSSARAPRFFSHDDPAAGGHATRRTTSEGREVTAGPVTRHLPYAVNLGRQTSASVFDSRSARRAAAGR